MSVKTKYYVGLVDQYSVQDSELINVEVLCVTRSGTVYYESSPADNLIFVYQNAFGRILFGTAFNGPPPDLPVSLSQMERVSVKFKY